MDNSTIFPMAEADLPGVLPLVAELGYPVSLDELAARYRAIRTMPRHEVLVWRDSGVQGVMHLEVVADLIEEDKVEIKALVVSSEMQGQGIGHHMITEARKWAKARGCSVIYLSCNLKREKAHSFYGREGFTAVKSSYFFERTV